MPPVPLILPETVTLPGPSIKRLAKAPRLMLFESVIEAPALANRVSLVLPLSVVAPLILTLVLAAALTVKLVAETAPLMAPLKVAVLPDPGVRLIVLLVALALSVPVTLKGLEVPV